MIILEHLKLLFSGLKKKKETNKNTKQNEEDDCISSLLNDKEKMDQYNLNNNNGIISNNLISLSILPIIYLLSSIFTIFILLILKNIELKNTNITPNNLQKNFNIPNYFELPKVNSVIFQTYTSITSLCGIIIVLILFSVLKQRFKVPEYRIHTFKLYIMMLFGLISNFLNFIIGFGPYLENNYKLFLREIEEGIKLEVCQLLFLSFIFFTILFSIYSLTVLNLIGKNKKNSSPSISDQEKNWFSYKIVILSYLSIFAIIYIIFVLYDNKMIILSNSLNSLIDKYLSFVLTRFPYFLHIINAVLIFSFYFEMKYVNLEMSQNFEVDYLFNESEKTIF